MYKCINQLNSFISQCVRNPNFISAVFFTFVVGIALFSAEIFALFHEDHVAELVPLTTAVGKLIKNACYIIASVSAAIGTLWSVTAQNLKNFSSPEDIGSSRGTIRIPRLPLNLSVWNLFIFNDTRIRVSSITMRF